MGSRALAEIATVATNDKTWGSVIALGFGLLKEYDDAYRYTFQDVLAELDKDVARKDIVKEIKKILDLTLERDDRGLFIKFTQIRKLLFLINYDKNIKQMLTRFFVELDLHKIEMDEDDLYHAKFKPGYNWTHEENFKKSNKVEQAKTLEKNKEIQN